MSHAIHAKLDFIFSFVVFNWESSRAKVVIYIVKERVCVCVLGEAKRK